MQFNGKDIHLQANGINICYNDIGTGGIPVLLIHGFPFDKSMWDPQTDFLKSMCRVITPDIRGFGKSTTKNEKLSIPLFADDLVKMLDALQIPKVIGCGLSMGGYILLDAMSRFPDRFAAIALCDTQCNADTPEAKKKRYQTMEQIEANGLLSFAEGFTGKSFCPASLQTKKELVERTKNVILATSVKTITGTLAALAERQDRCASLDEITVPALILCGAEDSLTPLAQSEFLHHRIKDSILHSIPGAGHLSNLEQPEMFNRHLADFITNKIS